MKSKKGRVCHEIALTNPNADNSGLQFFIAGSEYV